MGSILQRKRKCARFTCFSREDSRKYIWMKEFSQEMALFHDVCVVRYLSKKGKHSPEREHPLSTLISFRFHAGNSLSVRLHTWLAAMQIYWNKRTFLQKKNFISNSRYWIPILCHWNLDSGFQTLGFPILQAKISQIPESGFGKIFV